MDQVPLLSWSGCWGPVGRRQTGPLVSTVMVGPDSAASSLYAASAGIRRATATASGQSPRAPHAPVLIVRKGARTCTYGDPSRQANGDTRVHGRVQAGYSRSRKSNTSREGSASASAWQRETGPCHSAAAMPNVQVPGLVPVLGYGSRGTLAASLHVPCLGCWEKTTSYQRHVETDCIYIIMSCRRTPLPSSVFWSNPK